MTGLTKETLYTNEGTVLTWPKHHELPQALFPILLPLSYLIKEIEVNGKKFIPIDEIKKLMLIDFDYVDKNGIISFQYSYKNNDIIAINNEICYECPIGFYNALLKWNFDINNLIGKNLAIDTNTLK